MKRKDALALLLYVLWGAICAVIALFIDNRLLGTLIFILSCGIGGWAIWYLMYRVLSKKGKAFNLISSWFEIKRLKHRNKELGRAMNDHLRVSIYYPDYVEGFEEFKTNDARISELDKKIHKGGLKRTETRRLEQEIQKLHMAVMGADNGSSECVSSTQELDQARKRLQELKGGEK
jgi:hypothetical protein